MNPFHQLQTKESEIKQLDEKRDKILDKKQKERSESEKVFLTEYNDKLADLRVQRDRWFSLVEAEMKKCILLYIQL
jgi:hypothetical protein